MRTAVGQSRESGDALPLVESRAGGHWARKQATPIQGTMRHWVNGMGAYASVGIPTKILTRAATVLPLEKTSKEP